MRKIKTETFIRNSILESPSKGKGEMPPERIMLTRLGVERIQIAGSEEHSIDLVCITRVVQHGIA